MKRLILCAAITAAAFAFPTDANAQDGPQRKRGDRRAKILERFDADGDGQLSDAEKQAARDARQQRRGERGAEGRGEEGRGRKQGEGRKHKPKRRGRRALRKKALERFDADGDGKLNDAEKQALRDAIAKRRSERGNDGEGRKRRKGRRGSDRAPRPGAGDSF